MNRLLILFLSSLLVTACGWHLRGSLNLPTDLKSLYVTGAGTALQSELARLIRANQINLVSHPGEAQYTLAVTNESFDRRTAALGSDALAAEYEYTAAADFEFRNAQGEMVGQPDRAQVVRSISYDANQVLGSASEGRLVQQEMTVELASQIIRRLSFLATTTPETETHGQTAP